MADIDDKDKDTEHGLLVQGIWDFVDPDPSGFPASQTNRKTVNQQVIKPMRYRIPTDGNLNDTGFLLTRSKLKIRGKGRALTLRFTSDGVKDFVLIGWAVPYTSETVA